MSRILLFIRVVRKKSPCILQFLLGATFCEDSWAKCLEQDLAWLSMGKKFRACAHFSLTLWVDFCSD